MIGVITEDFAKEFVSKISSHLIYDLPGLGHSYLINNMREMIADQQNHISDINYKAGYHL